MSGLPTLAPAPPVGPELDPAHALANNAQPSAEKSSAGLR
jgi:hypothetical protein